MAELSVDQVLREAQSGELRPVYLVVGPERFQVRRVLGALRRAALEGGTSGFNEDTFVAGEADVATVLSAARTLPMFGARRLVQVSALQRWESKGKGNKSSGQPLDRLSEYLQGPSEQSLLLLVAEGLDSRRKLVVHAKKAGCYVPCPHPKPFELPRLAEQLLRDRGHEVEGRAADILAELVGADLSAIDDAAERVSLYLGSGQPVTEEAVGRCVAQMSAGTVWELVDAVGRRDRAAALAALEEVFEAGEGPRLVGLLGWSARQWIRFAAGRASGLSSDNAARRAGIPPFKVRETVATLRGLSCAQAEAWLESLYSLDRALKGGSKLPPRLLIERALLDFCNS